MKKILELFDTAAVVGMVALSTGIIDAYGQYSRGNITAIIVCIAWLAAHKIAKIVRHRRIYL